ncbi:MAG: response regulator [Bacteroidales bacterium]|nr:response regulator [Bacteroidales bacterium]
MATGFILLSATCFLAYRNLSSIVAAIQTDEKPELSLLNIREISMDLEEAENSVRIFSVTRNWLDIKPFYDIASNIFKKVDRLRSDFSEDTVLLEQTEDISDLIEENFVMWNELLVLNRDDNVMKYLRQLSSQIDSVSASAQKKEPGFLKRIFSRDQRSLFEDTIIVKDIDKIVRQESVTKSELINQESMLAITNSEIKEKFYDLISKMESEVTEKNKAKALAASQIAEKTYRWLILLSISGGLLAILVLFIIIRFIRNAYAYQVALQQSKDEAEKLARTKELFMANMSHEIRTPVTAISGFTDQLLHESFNENTTHSLKIIKSSSDHLIKIIDDILDFSKLQNNKLALEKVHFSISQTLYDVYVLFDRQAQNNNTTISYSLSEDTPPVLLGDPYRLKQIMINLVSNSVKFTKNGTVHIAVSGIHRNPEEIDLVVDIKDTGIGIDEAKLEVIFDDFTQAEMSTTRKYGGTGLGLSIVKKLIDLHHGTIDVKSRKNRGTEIICRIPYTVGDENLLLKEVVPALTVPEEISHLKILIVDDEEYNRLLFRKILERWKISCKEVVSGMDALEILKTEHFDLLFMDIRMPGLDGVKTAWFIREEMKLPETDMPIVFISAAPIDDNWQKYRKAGMSSFIQKPFTEDILLSTITTVIKKNAQMTMAFDSSTGDNKPPVTGKINLDSLYQISGGDEQFVKQMLVSFNTTTKKGLEEIQEAVSSEQWESAANLAHKIMSPCRHIGAMNLYELLGKIEKSIRTSNITESLETLTGKSISEFEVIREILDDHITKMK